MEKRVKEFFENDTKELEISINNFLRTTNGKLQDIKYQYVMDKRDEGFATALLIYTPQGGDENGEEEKKNERPKEGEKGDEGVFGKITPLRVERRPSRHR